MESTVINEVNEGSSAQDIHDTFIEAMQKSITRPLQQSHAASVFYEHIVATETKLIAGFIRGVRELEVALISCIKVRLATLTRKFDCH